MISKEDKENLNHIIGNFEYILMGHSDNEVLDRYLHCWDFLCEKNKKVFSKLQDIVSEIDCYGDNIWLGDDFIAVADMYSRARDISRKWKDLE